MTHVSCRYAMPLNGRETSGSVMCINTLVTCSPFGLRGTHPHRQSAQQPSCELAGLTISIGDRSRYFILVGLSDCTVPGYSMTSLRIV